MQALFAVTAAWMAVLVAVVAQPFDSDPRRERRERRSGQARGAVTLHTRAGRDTCGRSSIASTFPVDSQILVFSKTGIQNAFTTVQLHDLLARVRRAARGR